MDEWTDKIALLKTGLETAVPLHILELQQRGGPADWMIDNVREFGMKLASGGDALLFTTKTSTSSEEGTSTHEMFTGLAEALAVLAFCPGGVTLFGLHFEAEAESRIQKAG